MQKGPLHPALKPLGWLIGRWVSLKGEGSYPTIKPFTYCEELTFESVGQPMLNYSSTTWHPTNLNAMHLEKGFLRIKPETQDVAFMIAHNFGINSLEEGSVDGTTLHVKSTEISRMSFGKDPAVVGIERCYQLVEGGNLELVVKMETSRTPLTTHLVVLYQKAC